MSHILIQNQGELPIWGMRLLGLSNKTSEQIGQFGTGLKESIALLARMDNLPVIYSGECRIDFAIKEIDGQQEICFKLSERRDRFAAGRWHGLGMHPNFGHADWNDPWMVFREVLCNALDESGLDNLHHDVSSNDPEGVAGATRVYIPSTPDLLTAYTSVNDKLLDLSDYNIEVPFTGIGRVITKRKAEKLQVFHRGVWIQEGDEVSLFDYELDDLKLNESRLCDWHKVNAQIAKLIALFTVPMAEKALLYIIKEELDCYELDTMMQAGYYADVEIAANWCEAFHNIYGEDAVVTDNDKFHYDRLTQLNKKPVIIEHEGLRYLLKAAGVPHAAMVLTHEQREYAHSQTPTLETQAIFDEIWNHFVLEELHEGKEKPGLMQFEQRSGQNNILFGEYRDGVCYINIACAGSRQERIACTEEIAHYISDAEDFSRAFQLFLVQCMERLMS
jgi:hypothetical protein